MREGGDLEYKMMMRNELIEEDGGRYFSFMNQPLQIWPSTAACSTAMTPAAANTTFTTCAPTR